MNRITSKKPVSKAVLRSLRRFEPYFIEVVQGTTIPDISEPSLKAIEAGGKRLRPALVIIAADLADQNDDDQLMRACAAVELVHLASLVHDDVLDSSNTRRGVRTINARYGDRRAVIIGDYLFGRAFDLLAAGDDNSLMEPLAQASIELSSGELLQRQTLQQLDQSVDDYLEKIYAKTAALFVASCSMGARVARLGKSTEATLKQYAGDLGMAFQIYDDILDFTGDASTLGKPVGSDIREGTVTLPMIYGLEHDRDGILRTALRDPQSAAVTDAVKFVQSSGAIARAKDTARQFIDRANALAEQLPNGRAKRDMVSLGNFVIDRYH